MPCRVAFFLLSLVALVARSEDEMSPSPCGVCSDGSSIGLPKKTLKLPSLGVEYSCEQLESLLPDLYPDDSHPDCQAIQAIGYLCGCPTKEHSCTLCEDGVAMLSPTRPLESLTEWFGGITPTCEIVDAFLRSSLVQDDSTCSETRELLAEFCECLGTINDSSNVFTGPCTLCEDGSRATRPEEELGFENFPFRTCGQLEDGLHELFETDSPLCPVFQAISTLCGCPRKENSCNLCHDGGSISYPDKPVRFLKDYFGGLVPTCKLYESVANALDADSDDCGVVQGSSGFCGCPPISDDHCQICPEGLKPEFEQVEIPAEFLNYVGISNPLFPVTCELAIAFEAQIPSDGPFCHVAQSGAFLCGCNDGYLSYKGADNSKRRKLLIWLPRIAGMLSVFGASAIIIDVVRSRIKRRQIYNQLMASMSVFDVLSSAAWVVSTAAQPVEDVLKVYGEHGNEATCKAQAFFIQLSVTSIVYNVSLAAYFYFCIVLQWRGSQIRSTLMYLHAIPLVIGITSAFAGLPFYDAREVVCHFDLFMRSLAPVRWLQLVPVFTAIAICTTLMLLVWVRVYRQIWSDFKLRVNATSRNARNGRLTTWFLHESSATRRTTRERLPLLQRIHREVIWQSLVYLIALYGSWVSVIVLIKKRDIESFNLFATAMFFIPIQGFVNSVNYFRLRVGRTVGRHLRKFHQTISSSPPGNSESGYGSSDHDHNSSMNADENDEKSLEGVPSSAASASGGIDYDSILEPSAFIEYTEAQVENLFLTQTEPTPLFTIAEEDQNESNCAE